MNVAIIPARLESERLPRKVLADIGGKPMIQHVWERVKDSELFDQVIIAANKSLAVEMKDFKGELAITPECESGTDRCAAVADLIPGASRIVNVQADQPFITKTILESCLAGLEECRISTVAARNGPSDSVKVVCSHGEALYFSRLPLPGALHHIGVYGFRPSGLRFFAGLKRTPLEQAENLEQLRAIEMGEPVAVRVVNEFPAEVNTPEELERARECYAQLVEA